MKRGADAKQYICYFAWPYICTILKTLGATHLHLCEPPLYYSMRHITEKEFVIMSFLS